MVPNRQPANRKPVLWSIFGTRPEVGIFAVGNFNSRTNIYIQNTPNLVVS